MKNFFSVSNPPRSNNVLWGEQGVVVSSDNGRVYSIARSLCTLGSRLDRMITLLSLTVVKGNYLYIYDNKYIHTEQEKQLYTQFRVPVGGKNLVKKVTSRSTCKAQVVICRFRSQFIGSQLASILVILAPRISRWILVVG